MGAADANETNNAVRNFNIGVAPLDEEALPTPLTRACDLRHGPGQARE
jgi:hypothetical protein